MTHKHIGRHIWSRLFKEQAVIRTLKNTTVDVITAEQALYDYFETTHALKLSHKCNLVKNERC